MRGLYSEGLIYGGKFASHIVRRKFTVFCFVLLLYLRAISKEGGGGGLYLERVCGAYIWRGLFSEFYGTLK